MDTQGAFTIQKKSEAFNENVCDPVMPPKTKLSFRGWPIEIIYESHYTINRFHSFSINLLTDGWLKHHHTICWSTLDAEVNPHVTQNDTFGEWGIS